MKILVVNAGSSSLKYQLIDMVNEKLLCKGSIDRIGLGNSKLLQECGTKEFKKIEYVSNHTAALKRIFELMVDKEYGAITSIDELFAVGHRVLHAGEDFTSSVVVDDNVIKTLEKIIPLGPLHMPVNIGCIKACREFLPKIPMVAVFDTAFHMTMPAHAYMYAIRYEDYEEFKVRRYGFHGTSHKYVSQKAYRILDNPMAKVITCHLGNGASVAAIVGGKCVDTSMGLTPLEGLMMGTRSGDIDPACIEFLMEHKNMDIHQMMDYLNNDCGFKGVGGVGSDSRDVLSAMESGNERAKLSYDMFVYRVKKYIGSYTAAMGGVDCIVFTGGIGENSAIIRNRIMDGLEYLGIDFDYALNEDNTVRGNESVLTKDGSKVKVLLIPTNEELVIARETKELVE